MPKYNHRIHAGNAGDVWKHFILAEVADHLLSERKKLTYAESHVGYPRYNLGSSGEWAGGIGRCWPRISALKAFPYFRIVLDLNPQGLVCYPGSTDLVLEMARRNGSIIEAELWDIKPTVASAWYGDRRVKFHLDDGFMGVQSILDRSHPGMILIDPPYLGENEFGQAIDLLTSAEEAGWVALLWQMVGGEMIAKERLRKYSLMFNDVDLDSDRWEGATMVVAGADANAAEHLDTQVQRFLNLARAERSF